MATKQEQCFFCWCLEGHSSSLSTPTGLLSFVGKAAIDNFGWFPMWWVQESQEKLSSLISWYLFCKLNLSLENFLRSYSLIQSFFLGSQGKVLDCFHNKMNISGSLLWLCNENSHEQKVRKLGLKSSFLCFRVSSIRLQGLFCRTFTILSFYSVFKNPIWVHNIWEHRQDSLGETANTMTQATRTAVGSL